MYYDCIIMLLIASPHMTSIYSLKHASMCGSVCLCELLSHICVHAQSVESDSRLAVSSVTVAPSSCQVHELS